MDKLRCSNYFAFPKQTARDENFFQALHVMLCPKFQFFSVLFWITAIQIVVYIIELIIGGVQPTSFLAANPVTLEDMGQKVGICSHACYDSTN